MNTTNHEQFDNKRPITSQIIAICFIKFSASIAFAVIFSGLSLYLTQKEMQSSASATLITGLFLSLNYFLPFIGGTIANRLISSKKLYCLGTGLSFIGCLMLAYGNNFYLGLSLFLVSSLVGNVCLKTMVTDLFHADQVKERRTAFVWSYVGMNAGFLIGCFISGYGSNHNSFTSLFVIMGFFIALSVALTLIFMKDNHDIKYQKSNLSPSMVALGILILVVVAVNFLLKFAQLSESYIAWLAVGGMLSFLWYGYCQINNNERVNYLKFIGYSSLTILFWSLYMLTPIAFMQLIEHAVDRNFFNIILAPQWFINADSITILLVAPIFALLINKGRSINTRPMSNLSYFAFAFLFCSMALLVLFYGFSEVSNLKMSAWPMLGCLVLLAIGETFIAPIGDSLIGELLPVSLRATMTAYWGMNIGIGVLLATVIANLFIMPYLNENGFIGQNLIMLQQNILIFCAILFMLTLVIFICNRYRYSGSNN
ncbi:MAG: MFS transporter [Gammaproteobacteria bacterium]